MAATAFLALITPVDGAGGSASTYQALSKADIWSPVLTKTGAGTISVKAGTAVNINGVSVSFPTATAVTMPTLVAGTDYRVMVKSDGSVSAVDYAASVPSDGYIIGGFHYLPGGYSTGYDQGGNSTPTVLEWSFWDINYRPACSDPRGMTKIGKSGVWVDIYFAGNSYNADGVSRNNDTILTGTNPPMVPADYGGNGTLKYSTMNWWESNNTVAQWGKRLPSYAEMTMAAFGTNEEAGRGAHPVKTGLNTANGPAGQSSDANFTSKWGLIQSTGVLWIWTADLSDWQGTATTNSWGWEAYPVTNSVQGSYGKLILQNDADLTSLLFGGSNVYKLTTSPTGVGAVAGSRCAETIEKLWDNSENIAIRGACDHYWR